MPHRVQGLHPQLPLGPAPRVTEQERIRWAIYAALLAALGTGHPQRFEVARALEELAARYR